MLFKTLSAAVFGIDAYVIEVEVDVSPGKANFLTVGLPDAAVKESKERIRSAVKNCGMDFPFQEHYREPGAGRRQEGRFGASTFPWPWASWERWERCRARTSATGCFWGSSLWMEDCVRFAELFPLPWPPGRKGLATWSCRWRTPVKPRWLEACRSSV